MRDISETTGDDATRASIAAALREFRAAHASPPWAPWMRYRADLRSVGLVVVSLSVVAAGCVVPRERALAHAMLIPLACVMAFVSAVITHNTIHVPVFTRAWLNDLFHAMLTLSFGYPVCAFEPGHNLSHHRYSQTARDVTRTARLRFRWNLLNQLLFYPAIARSVGLGVMRYVRWSWRHRRAWFWRFVALQALVLALYAAMLCLDWRRFLLYGALPHAYATWGIMGVNFAQHDGCDPASPVNHSRNFVGAALNWLTCNNGYHSAHHLAPSLHWSLLPAAHAALVRPHLHPGLEQPSMLAWCWEAFVWPGVRRTYDGRPYAPPPPEPDEDWVPVYGVAAELEGGAS